MKNCLQLFLFFLCSVFYGQNIDIPKMKFYDKEKKINPYLEILELTDKNALIIAPQILPNGDKIKSFLVLLDNGRMFKYAIMDHEYNIDSNPEIRNKEVVGDEKLYFFNLLKKINSLKLFKSYDIEAYSYWQELDKRDKNRIVVLDGSTYCLDVLQKRNVARYSVSNPDSYIDLKRPGYKLKEQFLILFKEFDFKEELFGNTYTE